jgi:hypothetical protein
VASNEVYGLQLLSALRRNAYLAFPQRRLDKPFVKLQAAWWMLILTCSPDAIRHIMVTHADDYVRLPSGRRVLGPIVGRGLLTSEGELWRRQRRAMAPAFTPQMFPSWSATSFDLPKWPVSTSRNHAAPNGTCSSSLNAALGNCRSINVIHRVVDVRLRIASDDFQIRRRHGAGVPLDVLLTGGRSDARTTRPLPSPLEETDPFHYRGAACSEAHRRCRDLFDLLSEAHGPNGEDLLADEVSTMVVAEHETTAPTLLWMCTLLANSPEWQTHASEASRLELSVEGAAASLPKLRLPGQWYKRLFGSIQQCLRQSDWSRDLTKSAARGFQTGR